MAKPNQLSEWGVKRTKNGGLLMYEICDYQIPPHLAFARPGQTKDSN